MRVVEVLPSPREVRVEGPKSGPSRGSRRGLGERDGESMITATGYCPSLTFTNDATGSAAVERFAEQHLPFTDNRLQRRPNMARPASYFPRSSIDFRHVLDISQQPRGLALRTSLIQD